MSRVFSSSSLVNGLKTTLLIAPWILILFHFWPTCFDKNIFQNRVQRSDSDKPRAHIYTVNHENSMNHSFNVIAILTRGENFSRLGERLGEIDKNLADKLTTPIIIFHEGYPYKHQLYEMFRHTRRRITFYNVDRYFSKFPRNFDPYLVQPNWSIKTKWGYHHMINFWFKIFFELPELQQYEYIMRLDDDSRIIGNWTDVFTLMKTNHSVYMANFETLDYEWQLRGTLKLKDLVQEHIRHHGLVVQNPRNFERAFTNETARTYWNNFEIAELRFFRQQNVTDWVNAVIESQGIYKYRWGDAILRFLTLAIFASDDQVLHREALGLDYCHHC